MSRINGFIQTNKKKCIFRSKRRRNIKEKKKSDNGQKNIVLDINYWPIKKETNTNKRGKNIFYDEQKANLVAYKNAKKL